MSKYKLVNGKHPWISKPDNRGDVGDLQDITDELNELLRERDEAREVASGLSIQEERVNEAQKELSSIHRWIERNHPDGFIDSLTYFQNLDRITENWYDRIDAIEADARRFVRERDEAREERDKLQVMRKEVVAANKGAKINAQVSNSLAGKLNRAERERDEARALADDMAEKAKELITRWDQPSWKDTAPTAGFIYALRDAVQAYEKRQNY